MRPAGDTVTITHEPIPDLMGSMTMTFRVADPAATSGLAPGDRIHLTLESVDTELRVVALRKQTPP